MAQSDLFVFTSLQEAASTVVLEALSLGLPVICHHCCGMGLAVTPDCGIKIPVRCPSHSIDGFGAALVQFLTTPALLSRLSAGALCRSQDLTWDHKARQIACTYDRILAKQPQLRPHASPISPPTLQSCNP